MLAFRSFTYVKINTDISQVDNIKRNPSAVKELMRSISRNISTEANMSTLRKDMMGDDGTISDKTVSSYLNALRRIFVVEDLPAWNPSLRSKAAVRTSPKRHFTDPSIASVVMQLTPESMLNDIRTFSMLFESMCVRDLRVYSQACGGSVYHYRDSNGLEADAVVYLNDGLWGGSGSEIGFDHDRKRCKKPHRTKKQH